MAWYILAVPIVSALWPSVHSQIWTTPPNLSFYKSNLGFLQSETENHEQRLPKHVEIKRELDVSAALRSEWRSVQYDLKTI